MHGPRSGTTTASRLACLLLAVWPLGRSGVGGAAEPAVPGSASGDVRRLVAALGYAPEVGDQVATFAQGLPIDRWRAAVRAASAPGLHGPTAAAGVAAELAVTTELRRKLDVIVRQADGESRYWNLPDVVGDRRAQCLGNCQLWYVLGNAVGLRTTGVEVSRPPEGELAEHETHVATLIRLADGRVRMIDTRFGIDSEPFRFAEVYRRDGAWWNRADLAGDLRSQEIGQLRPYRPGGGMLQPALGQGQAALGGGPPAIQINQQPLLQRRQLLPLEIAFGVVMIGSDQFTWQLHSKALQQ